RTLANLFLPRVRSPLPFFLPTHGGGGQGVGAHVNLQYVLTQAHPQGQSESTAQVPQSPQNCTKAAQTQPLPSAFTQQLQLELLLHGTATLHAPLQPQASGPHVYAANAGVLMLVRIGAVQAMAAPAPIRFSIFLLE